MYTNKSVRIAHVFLDNQNPRHDPIDSEPEIIAYLLKHESIKPLARSISKLGSTSPLERIAVTPHPKVTDRYVSAEGNRRICALKLLADPSKAGSEANKKYFKDLADAMGGAPKTADAVIFNSMSEARPWLSLRHEGPQGGAGVRAWNSGQKARFNMQGGTISNPNVQATLLRDYAKKHSLIDDTQYKALSITTITRYLANPIFRNTLGLSDNKSLSVNVKKEEFDKIATQFLVDSVTPGSDVHSRTDVQQRIDYANKLRRAGLAPAATEDVTDLSETPVTIKQKNKRGQRDNQNPDDRKHVVPSAFTAHITEKILKRLYDELKKLDAIEHPFAAVYLLRAVIEQAATNMLKKAGIAPPAELHKKLGKVAEELEKKGWTDRQTKILRVMASDVESRYSPDSIGHFVHGGMVPTTTDSIKLWDSLEDVIREMITPSK